jgi:hypothetical protein
LADFIFVRQSDVELELGLVLAGTLITSFPYRRGGAPRRPQRRIIDGVIATLLEALRAERMADDAVVTLWTHRKPADALEPPYDRELVERHTAAHIVVPVRVDARAAGTLKTARTRARQSSQWP